MLPQCMAEEITRNARVIDEGQSLSVLLGLAAFDKVVTGSRLVRAD